MAGLWGHMHTWTHTHTHPRCADVEAMNVVYSWPHPPMVCTLCVLMFTYHRCVGVLAMTGVSGVCVLHQYTHQWCQHYVYSCIHWCTHTAVYTQASTQHWHTEDLISSSIQEWWGYLHVYWYITCVHSQIIIWSWTITSSISLAYRGGVILNLNISSYWLLVHLIITVGSFTT